MDKHQAARLRHMAENDQNEAGLLRFFDSLDQEDFDSIHGFVSATIAKCQDADEDRGRILANLLAYGWNTALIKFSDYASHVDFEE